MHANVSALKPKGFFAEIVLKHRERIDPPPHAEDSVSVSIRGRIAMPIFDEIGRFGAALRKARRNSQAIRVLTPELQKMKLPDDKSFGQAVAVYGDRAGDVFNIGSAREASDWLLYEWPDGTIDSLKARAARQACAAALDGGDAEIARLAFRLAVEEAGNLIGDVDRVHKGADPSS
ncbi:DUF982 domain-containing protein [Mesorhizobium sp. AaZ16]|uniref:DUF982 domain-containing protein n=1 Tax=Mesorhizobium sp. AaZ16 TaxID=3402289 RepID=UPI00374E7413